MKEQIKIVIIKIIAILCMGYGVWKILPIIKFLLRKDVELFSGAMQIFLFVLFSTIALGFIFIGIGLFSLKKESRRLFLWWLFIGLIEMPGLILDALVRSNVAYRNFYYFFIYLIVFFVSLYFFKQKDVKQIFKD